MINVGDILSTVGCVQFRGGYHEYCGVGDIFSTVEMFSTMGDIMVHVGEYHEYHGGCSVPSGIS